MRAAVAAAGALSSNFGRSRSEGHRPRRNHIWLISRMWKSVIGNMTSFTWASSNVIRGNLAKTSCGAKYLGIGRKSDPKRKRTIFTGATSTCGGMSDMCVTSAEGKPAASSLSGWWDKCVLSSPTSLKSEPSESPM